MEKKELQDLKKNIKEIEKQLKSEFSKPIINNVINSFDKHKIIIKVAIPVLKVTQEWKMIKTFISRLTNFIQIIFIDSTIFSKLPNDILKKISKDHENMLIKHGNKHDTFTFDNLETLSLFLQKHHFVDSIIGGNLSEQELNIDIFLAHLDLMYKNQTDGIISSFVWVRNKENKKQEDNYFITDSIIYEESSYEIMAKSAYDTAKKVALIFKKQPSIALLSTTKKFEKNINNDISNVKNAKDILYDLGLNVIGEINLDMALNKAFILKTYKNQLSNLSQFVKPNIFLMPNLLASELLVKSMVYFGNYQVIGSFLNGTNQPIAYLNKYMEKSEIILTIIMTAFMNLYAKLDQLVNK